MSDKHCDNEKATYSQRSKEHYAKILEELKGRVMSERQREMLEKIDKEVEGEKENHDN